MNKETFLSEAVFAKLVFTPEGPGILVAGEVFRVVPPAGAELYSREPFAEWIVSALRNGPRLTTGVVGLAGAGSQAGAATTGRNDDVMATDKAGAA